MKKIIFFLLFVNVLFADTITLTSGISISGNVEKGEMDYYKISASNGDTVTVLLDGMDNDADLHVRKGALPNGGTYDCKSTNGGTNSDTCSITLTSDEDIYIRIYGYRTANYQVTATIEAGGNDGLNISGSVAQGETKFYTVSALAGQTVNAVLDGLDADADLYVRIAAKPTGETYDCKSTQGGINSDSCSVTVNENAIVHIAVYGYRAANFTLTATVTGDDVQSITSGETVSSSVARDAINYYKISSLSGEQVTATITALTADADVYIKKGSKPSTSSYDCKSTNGGTNSDSCSIDIQSNIEVYIGIAGFRAASYTLNVTSELELIPANPEIPTVLEDAEGGTLNPNWETVRGGIDGYIHPTPNIAGAPTGTGVMVHQADGNAGSAFRYHLPVNNTSQRVLSMDCGGLPNHRMRGMRKGYIPHHGVGVVVETREGRRIMTWDSWYTHQGYGPRKTDNGHNVFLNYPAPVEMVRGWYAPTNLWTHFEVNLDDALHALEPNNDIIRIVLFHTTGGYLDNITLSAAN